MNRMWPDPNVGESIEGYAEEQLTPPEETPSLFSSSATFGFLPGMQLGSAMGLPPLVAGVVDEISNPVNWLIMALLAPTALGVAGKMFFSPLVKAGITTAGRIARVAPGLTGMAKAEGVLSTVSRLAAVKKHPELLATLEKAFKAQDRKMIKSSLDAIERVGKNIPNSEDAILRSMRTRRWRGDAEAMFNRMDEIKSGLAKDYRKMLATKPAEAAKLGITEESLEAMARRTAWQRPLARGSYENVDRLGATMADRLAAGQEAGLRLINPFTGSEKWVLKKPTFLNPIIEAVDDFWYQRDMAGKSFFNDAKSMLGMSIPTGIVAGRVAASADDIAKVSNELDSAVSDSLWSLASSAKARDGLQAVVGGPGNTFTEMAGFASPFADPAATIFQKSANLGQIYANHMELAMTNSRRMRDAMRGFMATTGDATPSSFWAKLGFLGHVNTGEEKLLQMRMSGVEEVLQKFGTWDEAATWMKSVESEAAEKGSSIMAHMMQKGAEGEKALDSYLAMKAMGEPGLKVMRTWEKYATGMQAVVENEMLDMGLPNAIPGWKKNYYHNNVVLTAKGRETLKDTPAFLQHWEKNVAKKPGALHTANLDLDALRKMEKEGLIVLTSKDPSNMIEHYHQSVSQWLLENRMLKTLDNAGSLDGHPLFIKMDDIKALEEVKAKGLNYSSNYAAQVHPTLAGKMVHPDVAKAIAPYFEMPSPMAEYPEIIQRSVDAAFKVNAFGKKALLSFSNFHMNSLLAGALGVMGTPHFLFSDVARGPALKGAIIGGVATGGLAAAAGADEWSVGAGAVGALAGGVFGGGMGMVSSGLKLLHNRPDFVRQFINAGGTLAKIDPTSERAIQELLDKALTHNGMFGKAAQGVRRYNQVYDRFLWEDYLTGMKLAVANERYNQLLKKSMGKLPMDSKGVVEFNADLMKTVAREANQVLGGVDMRQMGLSARAERGLNSFMLAPGWTWSNLAVGRDMFVNIPAYRRMLIGGAGGLAVGAMTGMPLTGMVGGAAFGGATIPMQAWQRGAITPAAERLLMESAGKGVVKRWEAAVEAVNMSVAKNDAPAQAAIGFMARSFAGMGIAIESANFAMTGHGTWENSPGHKYDLQLPWRDDEGRPQFVRLGKSVMEPWEWATAPVHTTAKKMAWLPKNAMRIFTNRDYDGAPIVAPSDGFVAATAKELGYVASSFTPISLQHADDLLSGTHPATFIIGMAGLPTRAGRPSPNWVRDNALDEQGAMEFERATAPYYYQERSTSEDWATGQDQLQAYGIKR